MSVVAGRAFAVALVAVCVTGCTTTKSGTAPTPVVSHSIAPTSPPPPVASETASVGSSASSSPSAPVLPSGCSQLLPLGTLEKILGFGILGQVNYLKAAPVPQSGRTGRVTCSYGNSIGQIPASPAASPSKASASPAPPPLLQISYITYVDAKTAASRVQATVEADGASAVVTDVTVNGKPANVLIGSTSSELVMSDGARTIVVVALATVLTPDKAADGLESIAEAMLRFGQPPASPSPASTS
ncbi:MAG TPA: hypothetical protein VGD55_14250 [Acidothermaceae bacterium]